MPNMMFPASLLLLTSALSSLPLGDAMYTKTSPVLQVDFKNYDSLISKSNHTSIVEFYAPWCGHCQSLKPAYEKAAKSLAGLAKVAAVNCDEEPNKPLCGKMGVQGFPTLKIVRPGSKPGRPVVEDYQGARSAKAIVDAVVDKIPNHVKKLQESDLDSWLTDDKTQAKAILFTEKGTTGPLLKSLAVDFLGSISFAQMRSKEKAVVERYGIEKFPAIILIPSKNENPVKFVDEMKRDTLITFFNQVASPNPDPAPKDAKASKASKSSKPSKGEKSSSRTAASEFSKASKAHQSIDLEDFLAGSETIVLDDDTPLDSPLPIVKNGEIPIEVPEISPPIPELSTAEDLESKCLSGKSGNCVLVLLPSGNDPESDLPQNAIDALTGLAEIAQKYKKRKAHTIPSFSIPSMNQAATRLRNELGLQSVTELEILALNVKRRWWRSYTAESYGVKDLESFVDSIKLGEGTKRPLPEHFHEDSSTKSERASESKDEAEATVEGSQFKYDEL